MVRIGTIDEKKGPVRLTRDQAHSLGPHVARALEHRSRHELIDALFDVAEQAASTAPSDIMQAADVVEMEHDVIITVTEVRGEWFSYGGSAGQMFTARRVRVKRIVTRATPRAGDTVEHLDHPDWGDGMIYTHGGEDTVIAVAFSNSGSKWPTLDKCISRLRIVHRPVAKGVTVKHYRMRKIEGSEQ